MLSKTSIAAAAVATMAAANPNEHGFAEMQSYYTGYVAKFNKQYLSTQEFLARLSIFSHSDDLIRDHNRRGASFVLGHN